MKIESIRLKNFKAFKDAEISQVPPFCVLVGANGTGKSTLFSVFGFLKDAFTNNVHVALTRIGGSRGFQEVRSRESTGGIEIELKFREGATSPLITYLLVIDEREGAPYVKQEIVKYRRGSKGKPWHFLDFTDGSGFAVTNEFETSIMESTRLTREEQSLKSPDILAIKGLAQFEKFPAVKALGDLIENWHLSDFHVYSARPEAQAGYAEHLSSQGENLALVTEYLYKRHPTVFDLILKKLAMRVPGVTSVEAKTTEEGRVLLRFQDGSFQDPFLAKYVSDGTIKMLAYLILLHDPKPHPLLCIEEPENQLYPKLLSELAEEFREYANRGGQVFVSTHSPDFLNAMKPEEVFLLNKSNGYTVIKRASGDPQINQYYKAGDQLGNLWKQGLLIGFDPNS